MKPSFSLHRPLFFAVCLVLLSIMPTVAAQPGTQRDETLVSAERLRAEIALREAIGFRSDPNYVRSVHSMPDAVKDESVEVLFTAAEAAEFQVRRELEKDADTLQSYFATTPDLQNVFGGMYIDHKVSGRLVLQLVETDPLADELPKMLPSLLHPNRLQVQLVAWPYHHLRQQFEFLSNVGPNHPELHSVYIDDVANRVVVTINPVVVDLTTSGVVVDKTTLSTSFAQIVADAAIVVQTGEKVVVAPTAAKGGDGWGWNSANPHDTRCTLGFEVRGASSNYMVTAGHCVSSLSLNTLVYSNGTQIGTYPGIYQDGAPSNVGYGIDAGLLKMTNAATATDNIGSRDIDGTNGDYTVGRTRCFHGKNSGVVCGTITQGSLTFRSDSNGRYYRDMFLLSPTGQGGDSGAPVYSTEGVAYAYVAGVVMGNILVSGGEDSVHSKWANVSGAFGVSLVTTD